MWYCLLQTSAQCLYRRWATNFRLEIARNDPNMPWRRKSIVVAVVAYGCPHPDDPIEQDVDGENTKIHVQEMFPVFWGLP